MNHKISVVIPVYTAEKFLKRCVDSVLAQTYSDVEIILVDDGSTDSSPVICDEFAAKYNHIKVVHHENMGSSLSRDAGIKKSSGDFVFFVDADDWIEPYALENLLNVLEETDADIVCGLSKKISTDGNILFTEKNKTNLVCDTISDKIYNECITRKITTSSCGKLIKKDVLSKVFFLKDNPIGEDHDFVFQLIKNSSRIVVTEFFVYNYYTNFNSISHSGYNEKYANSFFNYVKLCNETVSLAPQYEKQIRAFYAEFEMSVITAMCRNDFYDWNLIRKLQDVLRKDMKNILQSTSTAFYMKVSAIVVAFAPRLFIAIYKTAYKLFVTKFGRTGTALKKRKAK